MSGGEQGGAGFVHGGVGGDDRPHHVGFKIGCLNAEAGGDAGESGPVIVHDGFAGDSNDTRVGKQGVGLVRVVERAVLDFSVFIHLEQSRRVGELDTIDVFEVRGGGAPGKRFEGLRGGHVGATLMVARAGKPPVREREQAVKRMNQAGVQVKGFVFNDLKTDRQRYRYGYKGYVYRYSYKEKP